MVDLLEAYRARCKKMGLPILEGDNGDRVQATEFNTGEGIYEYQDEGLVAINAVHLILLSPSGAHVYEGVHSVSWQQFKKGDAVTVKVEIVL